MHITKSHRTAVIILWLCIFLVPASSIEPDEWQGWRGLEKQACSDSTDLPVEWSSIKNVAWKAEIKGEGHSSPVVSEKYVFITAASSDGDRINLSSIAVNVILITVLFFILLNLISLIRDFLIYRELTNDRSNSVLVLFCLYGFFIFTFCILYWMHFNENRAQPERIFLNYIFTGAVFFLALLFLLIRASKSSLIRVFGGLFVIILTGLFIKSLPLQDYYTLSDFFQIWSIQLVIPGIILPVIISLYLIFKTFITRSRSVQEPEHSIINQNPLNTPVSYRLRLIQAAGAMLLGLTGFFSIPVIAIAKSLVANKLARIREGFKSGTLFDPDSSYPYFLGVLIAGFLLWFFIESKKHNYRSKNQTYLFPVILTCSALFFLLNNFGMHDPRYKREIICFDRYTGVVKWRIDCFAGDAVSCSNYNSQATPTPVIHENSVYAYFGSAGLVSADFDGDIRWENTNLPFESIHGIGASPVLSRNGIIILNSMSKDPYLTSLDFSTGKPKWKTELPGYDAPGGEYRTPVLFHLNGQEYIIEWSFARNEFVIYDAKTGEVIRKYYPDWDYEGESIPTPSVNEGIIYLTNPANAVAIDIRAVIDGNPPVIWKSDLSGRGPATSSPVLTDGKLFMVSDNGFVTCLILNTGELLWQERLPGTYFSSPIVNGGRVYFSNTAGLTTVLECSSQYKKMAENLLPEGIYSTLAPVDGQLFVRTKNTLWCLKQ